MTRMDAFDKRRSLTGKRWQLRTSLSAPDVVEAHGEEASVSVEGDDALVARVLRTRGWHGEAARAFLDTDLSRLHDPFLFPDMMKAATRIVEAITSGERIVVYGDYDADGQTGCSLLWRGLRALGGQGEVYVPHRLQEGYGLHAEALQTLHGQGTSLIVTVDCGISDVDEVALAKQLGMDVIVTDHHLPPDVLPPADAIINPKTAPEYPFSELAGCGVAFKLLHGVARLLGRDDDFIVPYLDLVAVGTVADVVSLTGENRILVSAGLERINNGLSTPGVAALVEVAGIRGKVRAGHIGFQIGPRLNATGRVADPAVGVALLTTDDPGEAMKKAELLDAENKQRRYLEEQVVEQALAQAEATFDPNTHRGIVVAGEGWHEGVVGIVASRIVEAFYRPTVVLSIDGDRAKGSARSIPGFDLHEALTHCEHLLDAFGGHAAAAGMTLQADRIDAFRERFLAVTHRNVTPDMCVPVLDVDGEAFPAELALPTVESLAALEPFGIGNPTPVFVMKDVPLAVETFGKNRDHARIAVGALSGVAFGMADELAPKVRPDVTYDVAFTPEVREWRGAVNVQLMVRDVRESDVSAAKKWVARGRLPLDIVDHRNGNGVSRNTPTDAENPGFLTTHRLPLHPRQLLMKVVRHGAAARARGDNFRWVLAYTEDEVDRLQAELNGMYPELPTLRDIYRVIAGELSGRVAADAHEQVAEAAAQRQGEAVSLDAVASALNVFWEIGLLRAGDGYVALRANVGKVDVTRSVRYNTGVRLREIFHAYVETVVSAPPEMILPGLCRIV